MQWWLSFRSLRSCAVLAAMVAAAAALAAPKTVCTVTINSADEREVFKRSLPVGDYRFVELVRHGQPDWFAQACRERVSCDALIVSGHFDDGTEFYTDRYEDREALPVTELQQAACSASCSSLFAKLKEVYLFGCNTLKSDARNVAGADAVRSLVRAGRSEAEAQKIAAAWSERYGESNRERLRHIFANVPVLYGFASKAPLGRVAGPLLERYFASAPAGEVASGRVSQTMLQLFGPSSMIAVPGLADSDANASYRGDMCALADDAPSASRKLAFVHQVLQRDPAEVRLFLDHLERFMATMDAAPRREPAVNQELAAIERDAAARERFLVFLRDVDEAPVQARLIELARAFGWLDDEQARAEFLGLVRSRMARAALGLHEVDLVCASPHARASGLAQRLAATGVVRMTQPAHAAAMACLGDADGHERMLQALTSPRDEDVQIAQVYLRHRPLAQVSEVRALAAGIVRMKAVAAQVRALETLAKQRLTDPQSVQAIAGLFTQVRSLPVQRAIAGILIRADTRSIEREALARSLRLNRVKSPDGHDVIDALIRLLQTA
ncbi:MAG: hypothetical protein U1E89_16370 [Burkholderiaceae bacterium]